MSNFEKPNRIEELEKKLYSPNAKLDARNRKPLNHKDYEVAQDWPTENLDEAKNEDYFSDEKKPNWFFRFFILAFLFFIGAGGYLAITWYLGSGNNASDVDILVNAPLTIAAGEQFDFEVTMQNRNAVDLLYVDVEVNFPEGTRSVEDLSKTLEFQNNKIDQIQIGEIVKQNYSAILFGEESEKKEIQIILSYQTPDSKQLFKKEKKFDVVISSTPIRLTVTNVEETTSGQDVQFTLELVSNSTEVLKNIMIQATYPFGFNFKNSSLAVFDDKRSWLISSLAPKESITFKVTGSIDGQNKDDKYFKFDVGLQNEISKQLDLVLTSKDTLVAITRPFLEIDMNIDSDNGDIIVVDPDEYQRVEISYKNNSEFPLRDAEISLLIDGSVIARDSIETFNGFYQSLTNSINWDNTTEEDFDSIAVGTTGSVEFRFKGMPVTPTTILTNPEATFAISANANRNPQNQVANTLENSISKKIRFNTKAEINTSNTFYSNILPSGGPIPPKVEQKTTYVAVLELKNTTNTIANSVVTMKIPNYAQYEGLFSPNTENVSYDTTTRTLSWNVGNLPAKTGYLGTPSRKLYVQTSIVPSVSQAGTSPNLINNIRFTGTDSFTQNEVVINGANITTRLADSSNLGSALVSR